MPPVTLRTTDADDKTHTLTEYLCDWPDCPNVAEHVLGVLPGLRAMSALCLEHYARVVRAQRA